MQTHWTPPETAAPVRRLLRRTRSRSSRISGSSLSGNGWHGCRRLAGMCTQSARKQTRLLYIRIGYNDLSLKSTIHPHNKHCRSPHRSSLVVQRPKKPKHTGRRSTGEARHEENSPGNPRAQPCPSPKTSQCQNKTRKRTINRNCYVIFNNLLLHTPI